jgi:hypothetical protein
MKDWKGIMTVQELLHISGDGSVLHREQNIKNMIHVVGEEYILRVLFSSLSKPENYYVGLDNRSSLLPSSTIAALTGEPTNINGYERQAIPSDNFQVESLSGLMQARSPTLVFRATGGSWGPVKNMFIATALGTDSNTSTLISSVVLSREITVNDGEIITVRMSMSLSNCSSCG